MTDTDQHPIIPKCLLVDDLEENLVALSAVLRDEPMEIHRAQSGPAALELLLQHEFAVALLDVQMPEMSGFELAELMRSVDATRNIPIIFITAASHDPSRVFQGYEAGAVDFLIKPLEPMIVRSKVRVFLDLFHQKRLLEQNVAELQHTQAELQKALRARDEFLSIASHELRTPLTPLKLQLDMLERLAIEPGLSNVPTEKLRRMLSTANRQVTQLSSLIEDLLDASRIAGNRLPITPARTDLSEVVAEVLEQFEEQLEAAHCQVETAMEPELVGQWDRSRVEQIVVNLLSNVCKYAAGSEVSVRTRRAGDHAELIVKDGGKGIPTDKLARIFDRFERVDGLESAGGLGLGLYISREIAAMHGGRILVDSRIHEGSTFTLQLPAEAPARPDTASEPRASRKNG